MTIYINEDTLDYPRYEGDVALSPNARWAEVVKVDFPAVESDEVIEELSPTKIEGQWIQQFSVRKKTQEEIDREVQSARILMERLDIFLHPELQHPTN